LRPAFTLEPRKPGGGNLRCIYRTRGGAEIDLILEGDFGLLPIEIKYTHATDRRHLRSLSDFIARHGCPYGLVIDNHDRPRRLTETIVSLPATAL